MCFSDYWSVTKGELIIIFYYNGTLRFFKSRSKVKFKVTKSTILTKVKKVLSQGIHLYNIKALSPFVKKLW